MKDYQKLLDFYFDGKENNFPDLSCLESLSGINYKHLFSCMNKKDEKYPKIYMADLIMAYFAHFWSNDDIRKVNIFKNNESCPIFAICFFGLKNFYITFMMDKDDLLLALTFNPRHDEPFEYLLTFDLNQLNQANAVENAVKQISDDVVAFFNNEDLVYFKKDNRSFLIIALEK